MMPHRLTLLISLALGSLFLLPFSCSYISGRSAGSDDCLKVVHIASGTSNTRADRTTTVIKNDEDWHDWWKSYADESHPPEIDFETQMLFALTFLSPSTGYAATVDSACFNRRGRLEIVATWHVPGPDSWGKDIIFNSYTVYAADRTDASYYWTTHENIYSGDCPVDPDER